MNEVKVGKLPVKTTQRTCDFISKLGKKKKKQLGAKIWWLLVQQYKNSTDCFLVGRL